MHAPRLRDADEKLMRLSVFKANWTVHAAKCAATVTVTALQCKRTHTLLLRYSFFHTAIVSAEWRGPMIRLHGSRVSKKCQKWIRKTCD